MGFKAKLVESGLELTVELDTSDPQVGQTVTVKCVTVIVFSSKKINITRTLDSVTNAQFEVVTRNGCSIELCAS